MSKIMNNDKKDKMKIVKKRLWASSVIMGDIASYLEKQASKGLRLLNINGNTFYFEKVEPFKAKYAVEIFDKASGYDTVPASITREYIDYCEEAGWKYVCSNGKIQIFYSTDENVVPIETDYKSKLRRLIKRGISELSPSIFLCIVFILSWLISMMDFSGDACAVDYFIKDNSIYCYLPAILVNIGCIIRYTIFYIVNKRRVEGGLDIKYFSVKNELIFTWSSLTIASIMLLYYLFFISDVSEIIWIAVLVVSFLVIILFMVLNKIRIKYSKLSRKGNRIIVVVGTVLFSLIMTAAILGIVIRIILGDNTYNNTDKTINIEYYDKDLKKTVSHDIYNQELPLSTKDLGLYSDKCDYLDSECESSKTAFGEFYECSENQINKKEGSVGTFLAYEVLKTNFGFIKKSYIDKCIKHDEDINDIRENKNMAKKWKANKYYELRDSDNNDFDIIVEYDNCVLYFQYLEEDFSQKNKDIIYNKLVK